MTASQHGQLFRYDLTPEVNEVLKASGLGWIQASAIVLSCIIMSIVWAALIWMLSTSHLMFANAYFYAASLIFTAVVTFATAVAFYRLFWWVDDARVRRRVSRRLKHEAMMTRIATDFALPPETVVEAFVTYMIGEGSRKRSAKLGLDLGVYADGHQGDCFLGVRRVEKVRIVEAPAVVD